MKKYQLQPLREGETITLEQPMVFGRDDGCDVVLSQGQASRKHAKLIPEESGLFVEDLNSTNGTYVNEQRISGKHPLEKGDTLRIDTAQYRVVLESDEPEEDPDATVFQPEVEDDATVMRSEPAAPPQPDTPKSDTPSGDQAGRNAPPSWALEENQDVSGTQILGASPIAVPQNAERDPVTEVAVPTLVGLTPPIQNQHFALTGKDDSNKWEIGRDPQSDIPIDSGSVSQNHAQLINEGDRWKLVDLMSANGTFVNGRKGLTAYLSSGDTIRVGEVDLQFLLDEDEDETIATHSGGASHNKGLVMAIVAFAGTLAVLGAAAYFLM